MTIKLTRYELISTPNFQPGKDWVKNLNMGYSPALLDPARRNGLLDIPSLNYLSGLDFIKSGGFRKLRDDCESDLRIPLFPLLRSGHSGQSGQSFARTVTVFISPSETDGTTTSNT